MDLINVDPLLNLYDRHWSIRTYQPNLPPPKFVFAQHGTEARRGEALDSIVCQGCILSGGQVERSILGPNSRINSFSKIEDSILFEGVDIGRHAKVRRAIIDKGVHIPPGSKSATIRSKTGPAASTVTESGVTVIAKGLTASSTSRKSWNRSKAEPISSSYLAFESSRIRENSGSLDAENFTNSATPSRRVPLFRLRRAREFSPRLSSHAVRRTRSRCGRSSWFLRALGAQLITRGLQIGRVQVRSAGRRISRWPSAAWRRRRKCRTAKCRGSAPAGSCQDQEVRSADTARPTASLDTAAAGEHGGSAASVSCGCAHAVLGELKRRACWQPIFCTVRRNRLSAKGRQLIASAIFQRMYRSQAGVWQSRPHGLDPIAIGAFWQPHSPAAQRG